MGNEIVTGIKIKSDACACHMRTDIYMYAHEGWLMVPNVEISPLLSFMMNTSDVNYSYNFKPTGEKNAGAEMSFLTAKQT